MNYSPEPFQVVDLFCGAGGVSLGFDRAKHNNGKIANVVACLNHDPVAIRSHSVNFPGCKHFIEDIRAQDETQLPAKAPGDKRLWVLWASLECTQFSNAKTGPKKADSRTLAWELYRYILAGNYDVIMIENVREFMAWGDLDENGKPIKRKNGRLYLEWRQRIESMGYTYSSRLLNSANYGAYQSRLRYFAMFARPGVPLIFPEPTHDKAGRYGLPKHRAVRDVLDLEDTGESIFNREKPYVDKTLERILAGLIKFVPGGQDQYIVKNTRDAGAERALSLSRPAPTLTTKPNESLVSAPRIQYIVKHYGGQPESKAVSIDRPAPTLTTIPHESLVSLTSGNFILQYNGKPESSVFRSSVPCRTISTRDRFSVVHWLDSQYGNGKPGGIDAPAGTIVGNPKQKKCTAFLFNPQYNNSGGSLNLPSFTLIAKMDKRPPGLVTVAHCNPRPVYIQPERFYKDKSIPVMKRILAFMEQYGIADIRMRPLSIPELKRIQGLGEDYVLMGTKAQQKKFIGNAVVPDIVEKWIEAIYKEMFNPERKPLKLF